MVPCKNLPVTAEESLVGAMGCASWRSHYRLREYASLDGVATVIRGTGALRTEFASVIGLNEVGITDAVLAAIWRFGPNAVAYAISSQAEARHLGADIAIIHQRTSRILLYQAKLARYDSDGAFRLKSPVTRQQLRLLRRRNPIVIDGTRYQVTGFLALFQQGRTPFLRCCPLPFAPDMWCGLWESGMRPYRADGGGWGPAPRVGREYYQRVLVRCGCSPGGVLAARVPGEGDQVTSVAEASTWPWEFHVHQWLGREDPDVGVEHLEADEGFGGAAPYFGDYTPRVGTTQARGQAAGIANALAARLRLPASTKLYVITLP